VSAGIIELLGYGGNVLLNVMVPTNMFEASSLISRLTQPN
jgi:hypothetical protein